MKSNQHYQAARIVVWQVFDLLFARIVNWYSIPFKLFLRGTPYLLKKSTAALRREGVFPIKDHFYFPLFTATGLNLDESGQRYLPGINFNIEEQLSLLKRFHFTHELFSLFTYNESPLIDQIRINNGNFEEGDAEITYSMIRYFKPKKVIEIGSGFSTKIITKAQIANNKSGYHIGHHICIDPFVKWENIPPQVAVIESPVEHVDLTFFQSLEEGDLLFIDSSHMIRRQGDVLKLYLEIIPLLRPGVLVHAHDIFSPMDYPNHWLKDHVSFWNEQYLLEGLLSCSSKFKVILAAGYLKDKFFNSFKKVAPFVNRDSAPGSFYFQIKL